jgi:hypothetical protein
VLVDVGGPLAVFGVLRLGGLATVPALIGAGSVSVVTLVVTVVRERRISAQTVLVALLVAAGLGLTLVTHDPRLLLVKASVVFAVVGATMLASCVRGRPLFYGYLEPLAAARHPEGAAGFAASWAEVLPVRRARLRGDTDTQRLRRHAADTCSPNARPASPAGSTATGRTG